MFTVEYLYLVQFDSVTRFGDLYRVTFKLRDCATILF